MDEIYEHYWPETPVTEESFGLLARTWQACAGPMEVREALLAIVSDYYGFFLTEWETARSMQFREADWDFGQQWVPAVKNIEGP